MHFCRLLNFSRSTSASKDGLTNCELLTTAFFFISEPTFVSFGCSGIQSSESQLGPCHHSEEFFQRHCIDSTSCSTRWVFLTSYMAPADWFPNLLYFMHSVANKSVPDVWGLVDPTKYNRGICSSKNFLQIPSYLLKCFARMVQQLAS